MSKIKNYDSQFCGTLPLNFTNQIQPHGYLLVFDATQLTIIQASENVQELFGKPVAEVVNSCLSDFILPDESAQLTTRFASGITEKIPFTFTIHGKKLLALVHLKNNCLIAELEVEKPGQSRLFTDVFQDVKYAMADINHCISIDEVSKSAIHQLKKLTGFDGIMMYKFDEGWNGTVIAEEKEEGMEKYLGNTFPASDIPKQARQLYLKNPYRLIPNREYQPVRLFPVINSQTNAFTDLSDCNLRSVPEVHLEYLKNMNVAASMSVRVIVNESLWGLIACHHRTARYLSFELCSVLELLSSVISNKIAAILHKEQYDLATYLHEKRNEMTRQLYAENDIAKGLLDLNNINLLNLFNATGAVVIRGHKIETMGRVPEMDYLESLSLWIQHKDINRVFYTDNFSEVYKDTTEYASIASGVMIIPVNTAKEEYVVCFRPEVRETINWGGDPESAISFEPGTNNYHPRNSFKLWQQTVVNTATAWDKQEILTAEALRNSLFEFSNQ